MLLTRNVKLITELKLKIISDLSAARKHTPSGLAGALHVILFNIGFRAIVHYRIASFFRNKGYRFLSRWLSIRARRCYSIEISPQAVIGRRFRIAHGLGTVIGGETRIGDDCIVFHGVTIGTIAPEISTDISYPIIGNHVIIYVGAKILGGVTIGDNVVIAANSVVITDIPSQTLVAGVPARVIKTLT